MKNLTDYTIARRPLLAALASGGLTSLFRPLIAEAEGMVPERFLYIHYPCGTVAGLPGEGQGAKWFWFPVSGTGPTYTPSPLLKLFEPVKDSILPLDGLHLGDINQRVSGDKHAQGMMYMGSGWLGVVNDNAPDKGNANTKNITVPKGSKTIDQHLLEKIPALRAPLFTGGRAPLFPSLQLAGTTRSMANQGPTSLKVISYAGYGQPLFGEARSQHAFNNIFGSALVPNVDPAVLLRQQAQKKSILDFVVGDINRMARQTPASQRPKLDAQLSAVRALEKRIAETTPLASTKPALVAEPTILRNGANIEETRHEAVVQNMLEIIRAAFASDLTRVASLTMADGNNPLRPSAFVPNPNFSNSADGHGLSHSGKGADAISGKGEVAAMYARALATMLTNMSKTKEGSGTLLDNTLGMYYTECRDGDSHERRRNPCMLFGGKFLKLNAGQFMVVPSLQGKDRYVNDIWTSTLTAWGAPTNVFGDPAYNQGVIGGLYGA